MAKNGVKASADRAAAGLARFRGGQDDPAPAGVRRLRRGEAVRRLAAQAGRVGTGEKEHAFVRPHSEQCGFCCAQRFRRQIQQGGQGRGGLVGDDPGRASQQRRQVQSRFRPQSS